MKNTVLLLFLFIFFKVSAQEGYTTIKDSLYSAILKQNRDFSIFLPEGYNTIKEGCPIIYVLDAPGRSQHIVPTARFLFLSGKMPKTIIVGVENIDRNYDFLPASQAGSFKGGGADSFVQFFKRELIPYINAKYKSEGYNVLIGHSFGGEFAMHTLLNEPDLFNGYIAIDPSFWYDNNIMVTNARNQFKKNKNWEKLIYIAGRDSNDMNGMGISSMDTLLKTSAPKGLEWKIVSYQNEDHGSVPFKAAYDGLRYIFDNGRDFDILPQTGIIPSGSSTYIYIVNNNSNLRYTLDGNEPTISSLVCTDSININKACTIKVKSFSTKYNKPITKTCVYSSGVFMIGKQNIKNLKHGLKYTYYNGVWDSIPDFQKLKPEKSGTTDSIDLKIAMKKDSFAIRYEGYIHIKEKALYYLWINSDDGAKVFIDNKLVLDNDGIHSADFPKISLFPLNSGYYPLKIEYFEKTGQEDLVFGYGIGSNPPVIIPKDLLFYKP
jgi:predicted alpha/beta superfamily hydrolase